jgi:beta-barrel assembly-enhancing protease
MKSILIYFLVLILTSCATPQSRAPTIGKAESAQEAEQQVKLAFERYLDQLNRVNIIATKIRISNADLCSDFSSPYYGFDVWTIQDYKNANQIERRVLNSSYQLRENLKVMHVAEGSPAENAGLKFGDEIDEIDGQKISTGYRTEIRKGFNELVEKSKGKPIALKVWRDQAFIDLTLSPIKACRSSAFVDFGNEINAFADGQNIYIARGMLNFVNDDLELATVISHEIAHNVMHHIDAKEQNATVAGVFGFIIDMTAAVYGINTQGEFTKMTSNIGSQAFSVEFEQEADYIGTYFLKNAGYDISKSADFWRRMAAENPNAIFIKTTHPSPPDRFLAITQTVNEINRKVANNQPIKPEMKISEVAQKNQSAGSEQEGMAKNVVDIEFNDCNDGHMDSCATFINQYLANNSSVDQNKVSTAANKMKVSSSLSTSNKLILYDYFYGKMINPEKDLCKKILDELIQENNQAAILRSYQSELDSFFIGFNKDKKTQLCNSVNSIDAKNFSERDNQIFTKLNTKCSK